MVRDTLDGNWTLRGQLVAGVVTLLLGVGVVLSLGSGTSTGGLLEPLLALAAVALLATGTVFVGTAVDGPPA